MGKLTGSPFRLFIILRDHSCVKRCGLLLAIGSSGQALISVNNYVGAIGRSCLDICRVLDSVK